MSGNEDRLVQLYLAWTTFQRRQVSMAEFVGFECIFMPRTQRSGRIATLVDYIRLYFRTLFVIRRRRPDVVWLQLPQVPLLWAALTARAAWRPGLRIVADCHNAMFRPPWSRVPFAVYSLRRCEVVLVHNSTVRDAALALGLPDAKTLVLEDVPPDLRRMDRHVQSEPRCVAGRPRPWVLFPGSFAADEPIGELLQAARELRDVTIIITGKPSNAARSGCDLGVAPANVVLPGYLDRSEFEALLRASDLVLALTKVEDIQLSVCNEALGFGKAMVVSGTRVLRQLFGDAGEIAWGYDPVEIASAIRRALGRLGDLEARSAKLARSRTEALRVGQLAAVLRQLS